MGYANWGSTQTLGRPGHNLVTIRTPGGARFTVNRAVGGNYLQFLTRLEEMGYRIDPSQSGGYNNRTIRGGRRLSQHAFGNAIDVNWRINRFRTHQHNMPKNIGEIARQYGLTWGGVWKRPDPMHFEYHPGHGVKPIPYAAPKSDRSPALASQARLHMTPIVKNSGILAGAAAPVTFQREMERNPMARAVRAAFGGAGAAMSAPLDDGGDIFAELSAIRQRFGGR